MARDCILVIEDHDLNMQLTTDLLMSAGYTVIQATNAEQGIRLAQATPPALIVMDVALPHMDGLHATEILKQDQRTSDIPIIALTAHAMQGDEAKALNAGCSAYISKPMNIAVFLNAVRKCLSAKVQPDTL